MSNDTQFEDDYTGEVEDFGPEYDLSMEGGEELEEAEVKTPISLDFTDLEEFSEDFEFRGRTYMLKEASAAATAMYKNAIFRNVKMSSEGKPSSIGGDIANMEVQLVSACVFAVTEGKGGRVEKSVSTALINSWPDRVVSRLFDKIKEVSDMEGSNSEK